MKNASKLLVGLGVSVAFAPLAMAGSGYGMPAYSPDLLPSNPTAGMCYARIEIPAQYSTGSKRVAVQDGFDDIVVEQAQIVSRQEQVEIKEASVRYEVRQPTFKSVSEQVMVRPSYEKLTVVPPKFVEKQGCIDCSPSRLVWKRGNPAKLTAQGYKVHSTADAGVSGRGYNSTVQYGANGGTQCGENCEIWCLVEVPGESVQYNRKVIVQPAQVSRQMVPAKYRSIMKQVVADPGGVREIPVPAQYRTISVEDVARPATVNQVTVPTKYADVQTKTLIAPERYEWRQVVCQPGTQGAATSYSSHSTTSVTPTYNSGYSSNSGYTSGTYSSGGASAYGSSIGNAGYRSTSYSGYSSGSSTMSHSAGSVGTTHGYSGTSSAPVYSGGYSQHSSGMGVVGVAPTAAQMGLSHGQSCSGTACYKQNPYEAR